FREYSYMLFKVCPSWNGPYRRWSFLRTPVLGGNRNSLHVVVIMTPQNKMKEILMHGCRTIINRIRSGIHFIPDVIIAGYPSFFLHCDCEPVRNKQQLFWRA